MSRWGERVAEVGFDFFEITGMLEKLEELEVDCD
jgi:hypothetical protein